MFGSVTWWLFFSDGYRALDTLDDNRDGRLTGSELSGIAVWFDRNTEEVRAAQRDADYAYRLAVDAPASK